jgi:hypothetical protein
MVHLVKSISEDSDKYRDMYRRLDAIDKALKRLYERIVELENKQD